MLKCMYYNMGLEDVLIKTYELFLISEVIKEDCVISINIREAIEGEQYEKAIRLLIIVLLEELNEKPIYVGIKKDVISLILAILYGLELNGLKSPYLKENFKNLILKFYKYSLNNRLDFRTNKEKKELIEAKVEELEYM